MNKLAILPLLLASPAFAQDVEITFSSSEIEPGIFFDRSPRIEQNNE